MEALKYYIFYLDTQFQGSPMVIRITISLVMVLAVFYLSSLVRIFLISRKTKKIEKKKRDVKKEFRKKIREIILSEENMSYEAVEQALSRKEEKNLEEWEKASVLDILIDVKNDEEEREINDKTYQSQLNKHNFDTILSVWQLRDYLEKQLMSGDLKTNMESLRRLDGIGGSVSGSVVARKTGIKNNSIRKEAKSVFLKLDSYDAFKFLDNGFDKEFNAWDEIRIHDSLKEISKTTHIPLLSSWIIEAKNNRYKIFLVKEMGFFQQKDGVDFLMNLYEQNRTNHPLKSQIIKTLGELNYEPSTKLLIREFYNNPKEVQMSIIEAFGALKTPSVLNFLEEVYFSTNDKEMIIKVLESIIDIDSSKDVFSKIKAKTVADFRLDAISHVERTRRMAISNT